MRKQKAPSNVLWLAARFAKRKAGLAVGAGTSNESGRRVSSHVPHPNVPTAPCQGMTSIAYWWWTAILGSLIEGFALYGASLYPNELFLESHRNGVGSERSDE